MSCTLTNVKTSTKERMEIRGVIRACMALRKTPTETYKMLQMAKDEHKVCTLLVFKWNKRFPEGQLGLEDDERTSRKSHVGTSYMTLVDKGFHVDRRMMVREIADVSVGTVYRIITEDLKMRKIFYSDKIFFYK